MMNRLLLLCLLLGSLLAGCSTDTATAPAGDELPSPTTFEPPTLPPEDQPPSPTPVEPPTLPPTSPSLPAADPLEWLAQTSFEAAPPDPPDIIPAELPEGFRHGEQDTRTSNFPSGTRFQMTEVVFERPIDGQVSNEDSVRVMFYGYQSAEHRAEHLGLMDWEDLQVEFEDLGGRWVVRCSNASMDMTIWISGPYLITVGSALDTSERGPWVGTFAELILDRFPSP